MPSTTPPSPVPQHQSTTVKTVSAAVTLQSKDLLGTRQAIDIEHNGQRYRLQTTKTGKLILTK